MSAVEEIHAAIERLRNLRDDAHFGPWWHDRATEDLFSGSGLSSDVGVAAEVSDDDADLIVTLHRTIDAQLAILRLAGENMARRQALGLPLNTGPVDVLALARAINGGTQ